MSLLAARSPKLRRALTQAKDARHAYLVIDGTLVPIDRLGYRTPQEVLSEHHNSQAAA